MKGMGRTTEAIVCAVALLALSAIVSAQGPDPGWGPDRGPGVFGGRGFGFGPPVPGEPYQATEVHSFTEALANGNSISHSSCAKVYRASSGATRVEDTPNSTTCGSTPAFISITDPSAGFRYEINVAKSTYHQITLRTPVTGTVPPGPPPNGHGRENGGQVVKTSLGTEPISGTSLNAEGTQTTITIPAGKIGNAQPIVVTSTRWYSPDLKIVIQSSSNDPRGGTRSLQLSGITTAEPAASLFQLPAGLTLEPNRPGARERHGPPFPGQ